MCRERDVVSAPGCLTPTEILSAWEAGADVVKVFPATALGPGFIKDVLAPLPQVRLMPTGGVTKENAGDWIRAGAVATGRRTSMVDARRLPSAASPWSPRTRATSSTREAARSQKSEPEVGSDLTGIQRPSASARSCCGSAPRATSASSSRPRFRPPGAGRSERGVSLAQFGLESHTSRDCRHMPSATRGEVAARRRRGSITSFAAAHRVGVYSSGNRREPAGPRPSSTIAHALRSAR